MLRELQSRKATVDYSYLHPKVLKTGEQRPDHVNNAETIYFPPIFNQDDASCGSAASISYQFTYCLNASRRKRGDDPNNQLPSHFTWLAGWGNTTDLPIHTGVPDVVTYGGRTCSKLFGSQNWGSVDWGWMTGYNKWYSAMFNRAESFLQLPLSARTEEGREAAKNYLWNHSGREGFGAGGVLGIGVAAIGMQLEKIPSTQSNKNAGVAGMEYIKYWGPTYDHSLTIVGYDDRLEFDLDGNGVYGEEDKDEKGAWIIANSWGDGWANKGFVYCPYHNAVSWCTEDGEIPTEGTSWQADPYWGMGCYQVRRDYREVL